MPRFLLRGPAQRTPIFGNAAQFVRSEGDRFRFAVLGSRSIPLLDGFPSNTLCLVTSTHTPEEEGFESDRKRWPNLKRTTLEPPTSVLFNTSKTGEMLRFMKNGNWNLNLAAGKKYKTGSSPQQTILLELWLVQRKPTQIHAAMQHIIIMRADRNTIQTRRFLGV